jgi:hypothetical protein
MLEITFLIVSVLVVLFIIHYQSKKTEPFKDDFYLQACPSGYDTLFYDENDIASCCDGEVKFSKCRGQRQCKLGEGPENCAHLILKDYKEKGKEKCPSGWNYYEDSVTKMKGCTKGALNNRLSGPRVLDPIRFPTCTIYSNSDDNKNKTDSCVNQKKMEEYVCFGRDCKKFLLSLDPKAPPLLKIDTIVDNYRNVVNGTPTPAPITVYSRESANAWSDATHIPIPNPDTNMDIDDVAIAYYQNRDINIPNKPLF